MDVHIKQGYALNLCKKLRKDFEFVHREYCSPYSDFPTA
jgi:hypothetical protein